VAAEAVVEAIKGDWLSLVPNLGVGLGFRQPYQSDVFRHRDSIDFLEIIADHFFESSTHVDRSLELLSAHFPLIPHGLGLSLGSAEGLDTEYLQHFARLVERIQPAYWSEHVSFTKAGGIDIGHLTPLPKTRETLRVLRDNIRRAQEVLGLPLILENITETIRFPGEQLDDAQFLGEVLEENNCGLLLDVTNLYINSVNQRFDPLQFLWRLPARRIVQLHFVGGHWENGQLIDSHSSSTPEEIWQLLHEVVQFAPVRGIILERDERLPPLVELLSELDRARNYWNQPRVPA
jgi:uncharacterized protein (UPF0276 family)